MPQIVDVISHSPDALAEVATADVIEELRELARPLRGLRVLQLNATPYGGGVSEMLRSQTPLERGLGLEVDWGVILGDTPFFRVTKGLHNALQGAATPLSDEARALYLANNERNARLLDSIYDVIMVHDPQPAALRSFAREKAAHWIWRCHIDTSQPDPAAWQFLAPYVSAYDALVFTMRAFVPPGIVDGRVAIIPPAIDPLSPKNMPLPHHLARRILEWTGVRLDRPVLTQVSRFDPWKDPLGVIEIYRRVREAIPDLQLALLGSMALDDPESWDIYRTIVEASKDDPEIHVFTNLTGVSNVEVNAFQTLSDVVVQRSIREGFGLVVSETLWKGRPVVAGRAGGIPLQIPPESAALLVDSPAECAARVQFLLQHPDEANEHGARGREWVRSHFLMPRLVADELRLLRAVMAGAPHMATVGINALDEPTQAGRR